MCVAYPMKVKTIEDNKATISFQDTEQEVSIELLDDVEEGDFVIVHAGFAIEKLSVSQAEETIRLFAGISAQYGKQSPEEDEKNK